MIKEFCPDCDCEIIPREPTELTKYDCPDCGVAFTICPNCGQLCREEEWNYEQEICLECADQPMIDKTHHYPVCESCGEYIGVRHYDLSFADIWVCHECAELMLAQLEVDRDKIRLYLARDNFSGKPTPCFYCRHKNKAEKEYPCNVCDPITYDYYEKRDMQNG